MLIDKIRIDPKSRDDIPAVLKGLQHIWCDEGLRARLLALLDEHVLPEVDRTVGRPGTRAERLAWKHGLRAYDAMQLAAALVYEETIVRFDEIVLFGCFDDQLTAAANEEGLRTWPD